MCLSYKINVWYFYLHSSSKKTKCMSAWFCMYLYNAFLWAWFFRWFDPLGWWTTITHTWSKVSLAGFLFSQLAIAKKNVIGMMMAREEPCIEIKHQTVVSIFQYFLIIQKKCILGWATNKNRGQKLSTFLKGSWHMEGLIVQILRNSRFWLRRLHPTKI